MNLANILKQAQQVQKKLQDAKADLGAMEISAEAGNGAVKVIIDGSAKFKSIKLTKQAINPENPASVDDETIEMLEDLISAAMKEATEKASAEMKVRMDKVTGGIKIPGLNL